MKLPSRISRSTLKGLASPNETHIVRVIAHEANNSTPFRLRCRAREYIFERDQAVGRHILDIPVSVWMQDAPAKAGGGGFRTSQSIAEDFRTAERCPFSIHVLPIAGSAAPVDFAGTALNEVRLLLSLLGAPDEVVKAFKFIEAGDLAGLQSHVANFSNPVAETDPSEDAAETPAQARARKMREAKAAKKAAQLQPA